MAGRDGAASGQGSTRGSNLSQRPTPCCYSLSGTLGFAARCRETLGTWCSEDFRGSCHIWLGETVRRVVKVRPEALICRSAPRLVAIACLARWALLLGAGRHWELGARRISEAPAIYGWERRCGEWSRFDPRL